MVFVFVALSFLILFWCIFWQICDSKHSDLIPCLDRDLHHQLKLRLNLTLMEHYEHHCPPPERRFNCLVPPPAGYKVGLSVSFSCFEHSCICYGSYGSGVKWLMMILFMELFSDTYKVAW